MAGMNWFPKKRIFLDYASATPLLPKALRAMKKYWSKDFYNPSAVYREALSVKKDVEDKRVRIARILGIAPSGIIFTSGGTESDNLAILGAYSAASEQFKKPHLIISAIEHPAVAEAAREVCRRGGEVSVLKVGKDGLVNPEALRKLLKKNTFLVSIGYANSEIGVIQQLSKIGRIVKEFRRENDKDYPLLHTDASQAPNYLDISLEKLNTDLLTIDGAKIYGPKGIGVLAVRKNVKIRPIIFGGSQEYGRRAGTENPALISGFTVALETASLEREKESKRLDILRKEFVDYVRKNLPEALINGPVDSRLPNIVSVSVPGALAEFIVIKMEKVGVLASAGTACSTDEREEGSPTIRATVGEEFATATIRFSFGRETKSRDAMRAAEIFCRVSNSVLK